MSKSQKNNMENEDEKVVVNITIIEKIFARWKMYATIAAGLGYAIFVGFNMYNNYQMILKNNKQIPVMQRSIEKDSTRNYNEIRELKERIENDSLQWIHEYNN